MSLAQAVGMAVGVWLMAAPAVLGYAAAPAADVHRIIGPIAASAALVAVWEAARGARLVNLGLGILLVLIPLVVHHPASATVNAIACGVLMAAASPVGGRTRHSMGGGWRSLAGSG